VSAYCIAGLGALVKWPSANKSDLLQNCPM
jgi:hypothetical protein